MSKPRLGVYTDSLHATIDEDGRAAAGVIEGDAPFLHFVAEVAHEFSRTFVFGRNVGAADEHYVRLPSELELVPLPPYVSLRKLPAVLRAVFGTAKTFWAGLGEVDTVWCFGPHPFAVLLAVLARARGKRVVLGVRQDPIRYFEVRNGDERRWAMAMVRLVAFVFWLLSRRVPVTAVGEELADRYRGSEVLDVQIVLTRTADVAPEPRAGLRAAGDVQLLTVGRIAPEKNPELLLGVIRDLNGDGQRRFLLTWAGTGELEEEARRVAVELGLEELVTFAGHVPFGPELTAVYKRADLFVHVALTEGVPQVISEAFAVGLPVIATDVGGVRAATDDGHAAVLVPPASLESLSRAIRELAASPEEARKVAAAGLELARARTLESEAARAARFLRGAPTRAEQGRRGAAEPD